MLACIFIVGCDHPISPISLGDSVAFIDDNIVITNKTDMDWTNVRLTLNKSYTSSLSQIKSEQTVSISANEFVYEGKTFSESNTKLWILNISCDLGNGKHGEFVGSWH